MSFLVWDNALNSTRWSVEIVVVAKDLSISQVLNYPNPAPGSTNFTFELSHDYEITIHIYTVTGRRIHSVSGFCSRGFNSFPDEPWDFVDFASGRQEKEMFANC